MTPVAMHRIDLSEIKSITLRCRQCGSSMTIVAGKTPPAPLACPCCRRRLGEAADSISFRLHEILSEYKELKSAFGIEFDIETE